jgi:hypothetical protein
MNWLTRFLPRVLWSAYERDGRRRVMLWHQWGRHIWGATEFTTGDEPA